MIEARIWFATLPAFWRAGFEEISELSNKVEKDKSRTRRSEKVPPQARAPMLRCQSTRPEGPCPAKHGQNVIHDPAPLQTAGPATRNSSIDLLPKTPATNPLQPAHPLRPAYRHIDPRVRASRMPQRRSEYTLMMLGHARGCAWPCAIAMLAHLLIRFALHAGAETAQAVAQETFHRGHRLGVREKLALHTAVSLSRAHTHS